MATKKNTKNTHYNVPYSSRTACGLAKWSDRGVRNLSDYKDEVTCNRCLDALRFDAMRDKDFSR